MNEQQDFQQPPIQLGASGKAKTSLGLGIGSVVGACLCPLVGLGLAIPALILGIMALSNGRVEDKMLSIWGVVLSGIGIILAIINMFLGFAMAMNDMGY
jgi:hypothetical protein